MRIISTSNSPLPGLPNRERILSGVLLDLSSLYLADSSRLRDGGKPCVPPEYAEYALNLAQHARARLVPHRVDLSEDRGRGEVAVSHPPRPFSASPIC